MEILARAVGRRKEAVAQVQMVRGSGQFVINAKPAQEYLQNDSCSILDVQAPFEILKDSNPRSGLPADQANHVGVTDFNNIDTIVKVKGGGLKGQAEAIRLGISRALCLLDTNGHRDAVALMDGAQSAAGQTQNSLNGSSASSQDAPKGLVSIRKRLKDKGYLTQDSRVKERRKYGLKKARKATQYNKR